MTIVYLASFIGGLLLAVRIMIAGVERSRTEHPAGERSFRLSPPVVSSFGLVFGLAQRVGISRNEARWLGRADGWGWAAACDMGWLRCVCGYPRG